MSWWVSAVDDLHEAVWPVVEYLENEQLTRRDQTLRNLRLYLGSQIEGFGPYTYARLPQGPWRAADRLTLNVVASNIDTLVSKAAKYKPRPRFLTDGGNFTAQRKAKNLQRFIDGQFYLLGAYGLGVAQARDSYWSGTGITYWYRQGGRICAERVFPAEVLVDPQEALYGEPRQIFRTKYVDRGVLKGLYPDKEQIIESSGSATYDRVNLIPGREKRDLVRTVEAWRLPSYEDAGDGRYCAVVENGVLEEYAWTRSDLPFVIKRWREPVLGFWGYGISDELTGIQIEINKLLRKIQDAFHLLAVPWVLRETGSQVNPQQIANAPGLILDYTGTPPVVVTHQTVHPEVFAHLDRLVQRSYEITGVSILSATSQKPAGLNSGRALAEYADIESERFMEEGRKYEQMFLDYTRQIITLAKEIDADPDSDIEEINGIEGNGLVRLRWRDVSLKDDAYVMQVFPSSALPTHPAAKLDKVMELMQAGLIDQGWALKQLEFPDLESYTSLRDAALDDIEAQIEQLLDGRYEPPEPFQDLGRAVNLVQSAYLRARRQGASEKTLELLRRYIADAKALQDRMAAAAAAAAAPPMPPLELPQAGPGGPPPGLPPMPGGGPIPQA